MFLDVSVCLELVLLGSFLLFPASKREFSLRKNGGGGGGGRQCEDVESGLSVIQGFLGL